MAQSIEIAQIAKEIIIALIQKDAFIGTARNEINDVFNSLFDNLKNKIEKSELEVHASPVSRGFKK